MLTDSVCAPVSTVAVGCNTLEAGFEVFDFSDELAKISKALSTDIILKDTIEGMHLSLYVYISEHLSSVHCKNY